LLSSADEKKRTFLHVAVENDSTLIISNCQTIKLSKLVLNATDGEGNTALGLACQELKREAAKCLILAGCYVDKLSSNPIDAVTLENMTAFVASIVRKCKVDHKANK
jgi:ankyrin repeat protein